jgi:hypothetical protein
MPVARIYASLVEESEPLCGDLLARGYDVEVVFPDAVLTTAADLELRVERCSAEQAIARVEAAGSPSRCVFITPAKGPRLELLLVEMTVLSTGTHGRHPMTLPAISLVADRAASIPEKLIDITQESAALTTVVPFSVGTQQRLPWDASVDDGPALKPDVPTSIKEQALLSCRENKRTFDNSQMAELNAFLANAPRIKHTDMLSTKILEHLRHSNGFVGARNRWKGVSLLGGACSLVVLLSMAWSARPRVAGMVPVAPVSTKALYSAPHSSGRHRVGFGNGLIAQNRIVHADGRIFNKRNQQPSAASSIRRATMQPTTIKKITDLK